MLNRCCALNFFRPKLVARRSSFTPDFAQRTPPVSELVFQQKRPLPALRVHKDGYDEKWRVVAIAGEEGIWVTCRYWSATKCFFFIRSQFLVATANDRWEHLTPRYLLCSEAQ